MSRLRNSLVSAVVLLAGRGRRKPRKAASRIVPKLPTNPSAEIVVLLLLLCGALCAIAFILIYAFDSLPSRTQLFGASLGLSFLFIAAALVLVSKKLVVTEEIVEPYPPEQHPHEAELIATVVEESSDRISRKRLFKLALGGAGGTLGLALITPALSFGPFFQTKYFLGTPWKKGRRLVDDNGKLYRASDIEEDDFYTAFPEGLSVEGREELGAAVVLVRLPPDAFDLPPELRDYPADGIVGYSKICTHAGCAISIYRAPLFQPDEPRPALVCPCHYSTFNVSDGGNVMFGPAGRKLPMLPLEIDAKGYLRAKHTFDEQIGPAWWGTRIWKPNP